MDVRSPLFQNIALILAGVMFLNPIVATAAQLTVDAQAGGNTRLDQAANGVPIVNIATPSGSGLSHNKFTDYNVGQQGLILNNATERLQSTQQGGLIIGNSNLQGRAAGVILNEVTGSNRSQLKGYTEVAGQAAHVIVANPHGITCDGCGFINTPRATLSTGIPVIENGRLDRFAVEGGDIAVEGAGLNADNIDQFDLITRSARINAGIHANHLNIVAGRNDVDAATLAATTKADKGGDKPQLAIDSSALGGMYAGAIRLVGTEAGVGVKLAGDMAASAGDIRIDANGHLSLARTAASENLSVAGLSVELSGPIYAAGNVVIESVDRLSNQKSLAAAGSITAEAGSIDNSGIVEAGVATDNSRNTLGDVSLKGGTLRNTGRVLASRDLQAQVRHSLDNQGGSLGGQAATRVQADTVDNRGGRILARDELQVHTRHLDNADSGLVSAGRAVTLYTETLANRDGEVSSQGKLRIVGDELDNRKGRLVGEQGMSVDASRLRNAQGVVASSARLEVRAASLDNSVQGTLTSQDVLSVQVDGLLDNSADGALIGNGRLSVQAAQVDNRGGRLLATDNLSLDAERVDNSWRGVIDSSGAAHVDVTYLDNRDAGLLSAGAGLSLSAERVDNANQGRIVGKGDLSLRVGELHQQGGELASLGMLSVQGDRFDNSRGGRVAAGEAIDLSVDSVDNRGGGISSTNRVGIVSATLDNSEGGIITSGRELDVQVHELDNRASGTLSAGTTLRLDSATLNNTQAGLLASGAGMELTSKALHNGDGQILAEAHLKAQLGVLSNQSGVLRARDGLRLEATSVDNQGGLITSGATLDLTANTLDSSNKGEVSARGDLYLRLAELIQRQGALIGEAGVALDMRDGLLDNRGGLVSAVGPLSIDNLRALDNCQGGEVFSAQSYRLTASTLDNRDQGRIISADTLGLEAEVLRNSEGGLISGWQGLDIEGGQLDNSAKGTLSSKDGTLNVTLSGRLDNHGEGALVSQGDQHLVAAELNNRDGGIVSSQGALDLSLTGHLDNRDAALISAQGELRLQARDTNNQAGQVVAGQALHFRGTGLDNTAGVLSSGAALNLALQGNLLNAGQGQLASVGPLRIDASHIDNRGGELASLGVLTLFATSLDNADGGSLLARQALAIRLAAGLDNRRDGLIYSQTDNLDLEARNVFNDGGALQSEGDLSVRAVTDLSSLQGRMVSVGGDMHLRATSLDNQRGILDSAAGNLQLDIVGLVDNRGGTVQGRSLGVTSADFDNADGHLSALAGDSRIQVQAFNNRNGGLYAQGALELRADSMVNANGQVAARDIDFSLGGALNNQGGLIESTSQILLRATSLDNQGGSLRSLGNVGAARFDIEVLNNRDGLIETANTNLLLQVGALDNLGGRIRHLGTGTFGLTTAQVLAAGGSLVTGGALDVSAATWVNSSLLQAARLVLSVGHFTQTATGQLLASDAFIGSGDTWINHGVLASDGDLSVTLSGGYSGEGRLSSLGDLSLSAADLALSQNARISAGGLADISSSGRLSSQGILTSVGDLSLAATQLDNRGTVGGSAGLRITTPHLSNENGLLFSGADMTLQVGDFVNYQADVYSLGNLDILGQAPGSSANLVDNNSGTLESIGDLRIQAATLRNQRDRFATEQQRLSGNINVYWDDFCDGRGCEWYFTSVERFEDVALDGSNSVAAHIGAGGDLSVSGSMFDNRYSTVSAGGDIGVDTDVFNNIGAGGGEERHLRSGVYTRDRGIYHTFIHQANLFNQYNNPASPNYAPTTLSRDQVIRSAPGGYFEESSYVVPVSGSAVASAIVQAAGAVNITAREQLNNSVLRSATAYVGDTSRHVDTSVVASAAPLVAITTQLPPDLAHKQVNPLTLPGFSLPTGQNGLFRINQLAGQEAVASTAGDYSDLRLPTVANPGQEITLPAGAGSDQSSRPNRATVPLAINGLQGVERPAIPGKHHKYLIETNPALTELGRFLNSDYMLGKLGYDPDQVQKRLGDGLYEQRLIREAIIARTGQRFVAGRNSDEAMFLHLMDNAIASKDALNLSLGVSLSPGQVAALTHDIVWMEEQEVLGEKVLVPVLYLAQAEGRLMANGALIQGRDMTLISGNDLNNSGTLRASNNLTAKAASVDNRGLIEAGNRLELLAEGSIRNAAGGIIAGRDVSLSARAGDIINERSVTTVSVGDRGYQYRADVATAASRIEAANDLTLGAGRDIRSQGSVIQAGGDGRLAAGRDVQITSQREEDSYSYQRRRETGNQYQVAQHASELQVGGDLAISAGRDLGIVASRVQATGDINLQAAGNLVVAAAANESHDESYRKHAGKKTQRIETSLSQQQAEVEAGGRLIAVAGADIALVASDLRSGDDAFLYAGEQLALLSAQNSDYYLYDMKKKGSFGSRKTQRDEVTTIRNVGTSITTGGDLTLVSEGDQRYQRARLDSGNDLTLNSGGAITFEAVKDLDQESHEKSKSSSMWTSAKGKGTTDETLLQSQMIAQGDIVIKAVDGLNIDIKHVDQQTVGQTIDAMVKADPGLAWLKEMEQRGDVDWTRVKEVHDSFKYSHSGLGGAAMIVIAIIVTYLTAGVASGIVAGATNAAAGSTMAAAGAATAATATTAATAATSAGLGNIMASAVLTSAASGAAISTINNRGDLGAVLKDVTSSDSLKGYATTAVTAGFTAGVLDSAFGVTGDNVNRITKGFDLSKPADLAKFGSYLGVQGGVQAAAQTALQGGSLGDNLRSALTNQVQHLLQAGAFNAVGDFAGGKLIDGIQLDDGSPGKIALHAVVGGLLSEATGGDFKTGALVGGANELLIEQLSGAIKGDKNLELAVSQLIGVAAASATGGDMAKAAELAKNATAYNRQAHSDEAKLLEELAERDPERAREWNAAACALIACSEGVPPSDPNYPYLVALQAEGEQYKDLQASLKSTGLFTYSFDESLGDAISRNGEKLHYAGALGSVAGGGAGVAVGTAACGVTFGLGCGFGIVGAAFGADAALDGLDRLSVGYVSNEGQNVLNSLRPATHPGDVGLAGKASDFAISVAVDLVVDRVGGRIVSRVVKAVDGKVDTPSANPPKITEIEFLPKATRYSAAQIETKISQASAIKALESSGYKKTISQDGSVTVLTNGEKTYRFYPSSTSTGKPSASLTLDGVKKPVTKIRFLGE
ncbi:MAG: DUF637 domain-containing protein [Pseudomonas sp.]|uniref:two-partner secretion domain-containing protein n=1 Tax=Pseudomonas sp. TaxID=306 RepID=UPI003D0ABD80